MLFPVLHGKNPPPETKKVHSGVGERQFKRGWLLLRSVVVCMPPSILPQTASPFSWGVLKDVSRDHLVNALGFILTH